MIDEMKTLLRQRTMCVLATVSEGQPHCSLMAYAADESGSEVYLSTLRSTRKFRNIAANPAVSLLVDTREELPRGTARALTIEGTCRALGTASERDHARARLLCAHPHLERLLNDPDAEMLCVRISSFLLLKGLTEAYRAEL